MKKLLCTDNTIPVIENEDVLFILMAVITKSKSKHLYSNIVYIDELSSVLRHKDNQMYGGFHSYC